MIITPVKPLVFLNGKYSDTTYTSKIWPESKNPRTLEFKTDKTEKPHSEKNIAVATLITSPQQRWADCHILQSSSSPVFKTFQVQPQSKRFFKRKVKVLIEVQKKLKMQPFHNKNAPFLFHSLSPNPVLILNFEEIYSPVPIQIQQNLL